MRNRLLLVFLLLAVLCAASGCSRSGRDEAPPDEPAPGGAEVTFFRTNTDEDAILIMSPDANIMIDTGTITSAPGLLDSLKKKGVEHIDILVLTHPDKDHIGGAAAVLNNLTVDRVVMTDATKNSQEFNLLNIALDREDLTVDIPTEKESMELGALGITIYPPAGAEYSETNDYSIAVLAEFCGRRLFFAGDAEAERIAELLDEDIGKVDVYKLPHHGRDGKRSKKLLKELQPLYCIVTAREPGPELKKAIDDIGAELYSTFDGEIRIGIDREGTLTIEERR